VAAGDFDRVTIIGTGLIGASFGLALRSASPSVHIVGFDHVPESQRTCIRLKAVDQYSPNLADAVHDAQLVVIATPVRAVELVLREIGPHLRPGALIVDTASTKAEVINWAQTHLPTTVSFIGGHPMTGRLTSSTADPVGTLFESTVFCIVPASSADTALVQRFVSVVEAIGAVPYFVDPHEHDGLVAGVSHLPYIAATALMSTVATDPAWREMKTLAAGGFASATQLAGANASMYGDICLTNRDAIVRQITRLIDELTTVRELVERGDESIAERFAEARDRHDEWVRGREQPTATAANDDLKPPSLFSAGKLGDLIRGKRTPKE
jgi:prephenate dehydrogenase